MNVPVNLWNDVVYDLIKTDTILPKSASSVSLKSVSVSSLRADYLGVNEQLIKTTPPIVFDEGHTDAQIVLTGTCAGRFVIIAQTADVPDNFVVQLPNMSDVSHTLTTGNTNLVLHYGDAVKMAIMNLNTRAGHFIFSNTTAGDMLFPSRASNPNSFMSGTVSEFTYIIDPTSASVTGFVMGNLGVSPDGMDSALQAHIANHTDAHFGQDLTSTGITSFSAVSVSNTTPSSESALASKNYVDTTRITSHTGLTDIGILTHAQIDSSLGTSPQLLSTSASPSFASIGLTGTAVSTSPTTGNLINAGGLGNAGDLWNGGIVRITNTAGSISTSTGALTVVGGVGIGESLTTNQVNVINSMYVGGGANVTESVRTGRIFIDSASGGTAELEILRGSIPTGWKAIQFGTNFTDGNAGYVTYDPGNVAEEMPPNVQIGIGDNAMSVLSDGEVMIPSMLTVDSDIHSNGLYAGDVVADKVRCNFSPTEPTSVLRLADLTSPTMTSLTVTGSASIGGNLAVTGAARIYATTPATDSTTGSLVVGGGIGVSESSFFQKNVTIADSLTVENAVSFMNGTNQGLQWTGETVGQLRLFKTSTAEGIFNGAFNMVDQTSTAGTQIVIGFNTPTDDSAVFQITSNDMTVAPVLKIDGSVGTLPCNLHVDGGIAFTYAYGTSVSYLNCYAKTSLSGKWTDTESGVESLTVQTVYMERIGNIISMYTKDTLHTYTNGTPGFLIFAQTLPSVYQPPRSTVLSGIGYEHPIVWTDGTNRFKGYIRVGYNSPGSIICTSSTSNGSDANITTFPNNSTIVVAPWCITYPAIQEHV